ncbi:hypothetical protein CONLIGDRAFT_142503 [Coniochaeta ligniaria NRRL 30616]|uniref:PD-(D/E)XK nuclease-like domain-containing protein n=1 Tax=Coniochaeta ligniaria NRRL 30616 TaxID=1408157 RepID=A0A1J7I5Z8_9PEZI|nr:hypothetical protein CONLIGDRAFT_142503 [Coniochaeta ligniaria NRRL 30616]
MDKSLFSSYLMQRSLSGSSSSRSIESWLETVASSHAPETGTESPPRGRQLKRKRASMVPPVGPDGPRRPPSPAKRPRLDSIAADDDDAQEASSRLSKPVRYDALADNPFEQLPDDVRDLFTEIYNIGQHESFIPAEVRQDIQIMVGDLHFRSRWFQEPATTLSPAQAFLAGATHKLIDSGQRSTKPTTPEAFALRELDTLRDLEEAARDCVSASEAAWHTRVHVPLLAHATSGFRSVAVELASTAQIARGAMPPTTHNDGHDVSQGKMIDIAVVLRPTPNTRLANAIAAAAASTSGGADTFESVNQTSYPPLRFCPVAVSVETKASSADVEAGKVQLGVWIAAWHRRMDALRTSGNVGTAIVTLPLLLITGHQ